jgi:hypothetical protein
MSANWYLVVLGVLVVIGIALGFALALLIANVTHGAAFAFGQGVGMLVVTFGSCSLGVVLMYLLWSRIEGRARAKARAAKAEKKRAQEVRRRRRKKR